MNRLEPLVLSHLSLGVSDIEVSERFYRDVLQLPTQRNGEEMHVRWPNGMLMVFSPKPPAGRSKFHFGFRVKTAQDVDAWAQRVRSLHAEILTGPADRDGGRVIFLLDPDSYEIEIYSGE